MCCGQLHLCNWQLLFTASFSVIRINSNLSKMWLVCSNFIFRAFSMALKKSCILASVTDSDRKSDIHLHKKYHIEEKMPSKLDVSDLHIGF